MLHRFSSQFEPPREHEGYDQFLRLDLSDQPSGPAYTRDAVSGILRRLQESPRVDLAKLKNNWGAQGFTRGRGRGRGYGYGPPHSSTYGGRGGERGGYYRGGGGRGGRSGGRGRGDGLRRDPVAVRGRVHGVVGDTEDLSGRVRNWIAKLTEK